MQQATLTVEDLHALGLEETLAEVTTAVSEGQNVAVISAPFGGKTTFLEHTGAQIGDVEQQSATEFEDDADGGVRLLDDCHRLYSREIDGFDRLYSFLDTIANSETVYVTAWNEFAWQYLSKTNGVSESFEVAVTVPNVGVDAVSEWLLDVTDPEFEYVDDSEEIPAQFDAAAITSVGTFREQLRLLFAGRVADTDPQEAVIEAITRISGGNPGVAKKLWTDALDIAEKDGTIKTSTLAESEVESLDFGYNEAFALQIILSQEVVSRDELERIVGSTLDRTLRRFADQGLVSLDGTQVSIEPEALYPVVGHLETRRMLW